MDGLVGGWLDEWVDILSAHMHINIQVCIFVPVHSCA